MSTHKYTVSSASRWSFAAGVRLARHVTHSPDDRWDERTPAWACSPEHAFERGVDAPLMKPHFSDDGGREPERVRYFAERNPEDLDAYAVLFIIRDGRVTTVIDVASIDDRAVREYLRIKGKEAGLPV